MKKLLVLVALTACGAPATVASVLPGVPAKAPSAPAPVPATQPVPAPVLVAPTKADSVVTPQAAHVKVVIPVEAVYWTSADQRFFKDVVGGQPVMVNAIVNDTAAFPFDRTVITKGNGLFLDMGSGKWVGQDVVDEWFYAWNKIQAANPSFSPKQIQDAIYAGQY